MKKVLVFILTLICLAAIGLGVYAIVKDDKTAESGDVVCAVDTLKDGDKYVVGEKNRIQTSRDVGYRNNQSILRIVKRRKSRSGSKTRFI